MAVPGGSPHTKFTIAGGGIPHTEFETVDGGIPHTMALANPTTIRRVEAHTDSAGNVHLTLHET
jgi:hypothetical protein